jgi:hypothetical protein
LAFARVKAIAIGLLRQSPIERITCLAAHGQVMMDNLSYIALDQYPTET